MTIIIGVTNGDPLVSRVLAALLLVSLSLGALQCAVAAGEDFESPPACCTRDDASGGTPEADADTNTTGGSWSCPGVCPGTALPSIVTDSGSTGADAPLGPPDDWIAGCARAPDPFPPKPPCIT